MNLLLAFLIAIFFAIAYYAIKRISDGSGQSDSTTSMRISSLTSKLSLPNIKTIVIVFVIAILAIVMIAWATDQWPKSANYMANRTQEGYGNNEYHKDYVYNFNSESGQASAKEEGLVIFGTVGITNSNVKYPYPDFGFDLWVREGKSAFIEVTFRDVAITTETTFNFTVNGRRDIQRVEFGTNNRSRIQVEVNGREPPSLEKSSAIFNTNVPYNVIVRITGDEVDNLCAVYIDNLGLGA